VYHHLRACRAHGLGFSRLRAIVKLWRCHSLDQSAVITGFPNESRRCACISAEASLLVSFVSLCHLMIDTQGSQRITIDPTFVHVVHMDWVIEAYASSSSPVAGSLAPILFLLLLRTLQQCGLLYCTIG
jgi:hypothetical protein